MFLKVASNANPGFEFDEIPMLIEFIPINPSQRDDLLGDGISKDPFESPLLDDSMPFGVHGCQELLLELMTLEVLVVAWLRG